MQCISSDAINAKWFFLLSTNLWNIWAMPTDASNRCSWSRIIAPITNTWATICRYVCWRRREISRKIQFHAANAMWILMIWLRFDRTLKRIIRLISIVMPHICAPIRHIRVATVTIRLKHSATPHTTSISISRNFDAFTTNVRKFSIHLPAFTRISWANIRKWRLNVPIVRMSHAIKRISKCISVKHASNAICNVIFAVSGNLAIGETKIGFWIEENENLWFENRQNILQEKYIEHAFANAHKRPQVPMHHVFEVLPAGQRFGQSYEVK